MEGCAREALRGSKINISTQATPQPDTRMRKKANQRCKAGKMKMARDFAHAVPYAWKTLPFIYNG